MTSEDLLKAAQETDVSKAKEDGFGNSFDGYFPTVIHFRDQGMQYRWIFKWIQQHNPSLKDDREDSFCNAMSTRYRKRQQKMNEKK